MTTEQLQFEIANITDELMKLNKDVFENSDKSSESLKIQLTVMATIQTLEKLGVIKVISK